jgi:formylglycine-generating enzyme required for sulfatase activity
MDTRLRTIGFGSALALAATFGLACGGGGHSSAGAGGSGGAGGASGETAGSGGAGGASGETAGSGAAGSAGGPSDAGAEPPSCTPHGPGLDDCGTSHESCCKSALVTGGSFARTYDFDAGAADGGADSGRADATDPATVSDFRLDKYDVTVGRFRVFANAATAADGGAGWRPAAGAGKHAHLSGGLGLLDVGAPADAGVAHEPGWAAADDGTVAPTDANLTSCGAASTWTPAAGAQENLPINCITWQEAYAFCIWDGGFLPSEAEWQYAAAGGARELEYPWGATDPGTMNQYAIYNCTYPNSSTDCTTAASIAPVGSAPLGAGAWGQLDLAGDLWQWSLDWYAAYVSPCADCAAASGGSSRIQRGGSFREATSNLRSTYRNANNPTLRNDFQGVRCARSP